MKRLKLSLVALMAISIAFTSVTSCQDGVDGIDGVDGKDGKDGNDGNDGNDGSDASVYLTASKTPNFLKVTSEFSDLKITPILSSEDVIPNSPDFVYGSMADGAGLIAEADGSFTLINNIEAFSTFKAEDIINKNPIIIKEGDSINNMLKTIQNHNFLISFIPVTNEVMKLVGLVTFFNLIKSES